MFIPDRDIQIVQARQKGIETRSGRTCHAHCDYTLKLTFVRSGDRRTDNVRQFCILTLHIQSMKDIAETFPLHLSPNLHCPSARARGLKGTTHFVLSAACETVAFQRLKAHVFFLEGRWRNRQAGGSFVFNFRSTTIARTPWSINVPAWPAGKLQRQMLVSERMEHSLCEQRGHLRSTASPVAV